ncbi:MAG: MotA/TolQ/ExbB proton channel family protein [Planctomycetota bacterium]|jgi:biopolymer transport protein ExbB
MTAIDVMGMLPAQAGAEPPGSTWWDTIQSGGLVGYIIIGLSVLALALAIMHLLQIRRAALIPPVQLDELDQLLSQGDAAGALDRCYQPGSDSFFTRIMAAGLTRYQKSAFGAFEIKNAIEEAGEDQTARLYRSTDALGVIGSIAPLLGLLGTVLGMVGAFETLSRTATPNHEELAANISLALVTTLMGLVLAIPCIALHRYFGNRIDALASEAAMEIERLVLHLESTGSARPSGLTPRPSPVARPEPRPAPAPTKPQGPTGKEPT